MKPTDALVRPVPEALDLPELESDLDGQHPWPGLEGYEEGDQEFFKGRSEEAEQLYTLIRRERLTLLFGKAGTGKSSLVRAGLFPKQRRREALPVHIRLEYAEDAPPLADQVKTAIYDAAQVAQLDGPEPSASQTIWEYLHLRKGEFWSRHHRIIMPFIVFDQFEELFTHGLVQRESEVKAFISELSDLAEDRVPGGLHADKERLERQNLERHHYKLLVCVREEYLAELDRMRDDLPPALFHNRMRLTDMTAETAREVVEQTGRTVGADALCDEIVEKASEGTQEQGRQTELGVPKSSVNPALLAVLCTSLNQKRLEKGADKIARSYLDVVGKDILTQFYQRQLESLPELPKEGGWRFGRTRSEVVNDRIAEEFVDGDVRVSIPPSRARTVFGDAALAKLVADGILGHTPSGRVELLHDVLPETVRKSRVNSLERWLETIRRWVVPAAVAALVAAAALYFIGVERGKGLAPTPPPVDPDNPVVNPVTPDQGIALARAFVVDLNEGTRRVDETVRHLDGRDFSAAGVSLDYLGRFVEQREPRFCRNAEPGSWGEADMNRVLAFACAAVGVQADQMETLSGLVAGQEPALLSPVVRDSVVRAWRAHEDSFNAHRDSINTILTVWQAETQRRP